MRFFETIKQSFHQNFNKAIDRSCADPQDRQILKMLLGKKTGGVRHHQKSRMSGVSVILRWNSLRFLTFNHSILLTNFFKEHGPGWVCVFVAVVLTSQKKWLWWSTSNSVFVSFGFRSQLQVLCHSDWIQQLLWKIDPRRCIQSLGFHFVSNLNHHESSDLRGINVLHSMFQTGNVSAIFWQLMGF